jgi:hypothetical protein
MEVRPSLENVDARFQAYFRTLGLEDGDTVLLSGVRCRQEQLESTQVSHGHMHWAVLWIQIRIRNLIWVQVRIDLK